MSTVSELRERALRKDRQAEAEGKIESTRVRRMVEFAEEHQVPQTDTGPLDTGDPAVPKGDRPCDKWRLEQIRWQPTVLDTGNNANLTISVLPRMGDTGDGWVILSKTGGLNANFFDAPRQPSCYARGADTRREGVALGD
jgi:hypothetical protein